MSRRIIVTPPGYDATRLIENLEALGHEVEHRPDTWCPLDKVFVFDPDQVLHGGAW